MIDKELIQNPQLWQLVAEISPTELSAMAFCPFEEGALQRMAVLLKGSTPAESLQALESAVYDNPGLLVDFGSTTVLWRTCRFALMPGFVTDGAVAAEVLRREFPADSSDPAYEQMCDRWPGLDVRLEYEVPEQTANFIRRTFVNPAMHHALSPQALWFGHRHSGRTRGKTLVNLGADTMDVVVLGDRTPLLANTFHCPDNADAAYFILAIRQSLALRQTDEIIIAGDSRRRAALTPVLRRYVSYVMPAIFPAELFRAGRGILSCPFETAITPVSFIGCDEPKNE